MQDKFVSFALIDANTQGLGTYTVKDHYILFIADSEDGLGKTIYKVEINSQEKELIPVPIVHLGNVAWGIVFPDFRFVITLHDKDTMRCHIYYFNGNILEQFSQPVNLADDNYQHELFETLLDEYDCPLSWIPVAPFSPQKDRFLFLRTNRFRQIIASTITVINPVVEDLSCDFPPTRWIGKHTLFCSSAEHGYVVGLDGSVRIFPMSKDLENVELRFVDKFLEAPGCMYYVDGTTNMLNHITLTEENEGDFLLQAEHTETSIIIDPVSERFLGLCANVLVVHNQQTDALLLTNIISANRKRVNPAMRHENILKIRSGFIPSNIHACRFIASEKLKIMVGYTQDDGTNKLFVGTFSGGSTM
ncbi:hypothetical protein PCE1_001351 [Barthelona sp. PCE]